MSEDPKLSAAEIQSRMSELRGALRSDVTRTTAAAKQLADWRYYVNQFPWLSAAAVAGIGFLLVPRKRERPWIDKAALEKMVADKRVVVIPQKAEVAKTSMVGSVIGLLAAAGTRMAMSYAAQRFTDGKHADSMETTDRSRTPK